MKWRKTPPSLYTVQNLYHAEPTFRAITSNDNRNAYAKKKEKKKARETVCGVCKFIFPSCAKVTCLLSCLHVPTAESVLLTSEKYLLTYSENMPPKWVSL